MGSRWAVLQASWPARIAIEMTSGCVRGREWLRVPVYL